MDQLKLGHWLKKYRPVLLVLAAGIALMLLPGPSAEEPAPAAEPAEAESVEQRLERILSRIDGAGEVAVMLTEAGGEEVIYQTDGEQGDTVVVTGADRAQTGLVRTRVPPRYQGAVVVCAGGDSPAVRLALVEAVANATGLGTDRITVLKMEQEEF